LLKRQQLIKKFLCLFGRRKERKINKKEEREGKGREGVVNN